MVVDIFFEDKVVDIYVYLFLTTANKFPWINFPRNIKNLNYFF